MFDPKRARGRRSPRFFPAVSKPFGEWSTRKKATGPKVWYRDRNHSSFFLLNEKPLQTWGNAGGFIQPRFFAEVIERAELKALWWLSGMAGEKRVQERLWGDIYVKWTKLDVGEEIQSRGKKQRVGNIERKKQNKQNYGKADRPRAAVVFFFSSHEAQLFLQILCPSPSHFLRSKDMRRKLPPSPGNAPPSIKTEKVLA